MRVIVVSPHPDDETLGAGGTLLKYKAQRDETYWLNITGMKEEFGFSKEKIEKRASEIEDVRKAYGFNGFFDLGLRLTALERYPMQEIVAKITAVFKEVEPDTIILPYKDDIHSDHRIVFDAAYACTKVFRHPYIKKVFMMEVISETDHSVYYENFIPNCFIDVSAYLEEKIRIMKIFESEYRPHPFPRSEENIRALAAVRGSQSGCRYAEGFKILKEIW